jgi:hypothetical protein
MPSRPKGSAGTRSRRDAVYARRGRGDSEAGARDVEAAARQIEEERELRVEEERIVVGRKKRFLQSIYTYVVVNAGLFLIDIMSGPGWWVQWVLAGWGIALALGARRALIPDRGRLRARARRRIAKRRRGNWEKQVRKEVDRAIQIGVDALVDAASRKIADRDRPRVRVEEVVEAEVVEETRRNGR